MGDFLSDLTFVLAGSELLALVVLALAANQGQIDLGQPAPAEIDTQGYQSLATLEDFGQ